jgi:hypothetical protein
MDKYRMAASTAANLNPFFTLLGTRYSGYHYRPSLIFNYDETSLLKKKYFLEKRIVEAGSMILPTEEAVPPITHCTAGFCIAANGSYLSSLLILPSFVPPELYNSYDSMSLKIDSSSSGFINSDIFDNFMTTRIFPEIAARQKCFSRRGELQRALLFMDGHGSRLRKTVWEEAASLGIDVCILPPHTSHLLQPLDCGVNAHFKSLLSSVTSLPQKRKLKSDLFQWLESVEDMIQQSMSRPLIRHAFSATGLWPLTPDVVLSKVISESSQILQTRQKKVDIGGSFITDKEFLDKWEEKEVGWKENDEIRKDLLEKKKRRKKRKRNQRKENGRKRRKLTDEDSEEEFTDGSTNDADTEASSEGYITEPEDESQKYPDKIAKRQKSGGLKLVITPANPAKRTKEIISLEMQYEQLEESRKVKTQLQIASKTLCTKRVRSKQKGDIESVAITKQIRTRDDILEETDDELSVTEIPPFVVEPEHDKQGHLDSSF